MRPVAGFTELILLDLLRCLWASSCLRFLLTGITLLDELAPYTRGFPFRKAPTAFYPQRLGVADSSMRSPQHLAPIRDRWDILVGTKTFICGSLSSFYFDFAPFFQYPEPQGWHISLLPLLQQFHSPLLQRLQRSIT